MSHLAPVGLLLAHILPREPSVGHVACVTHHLPTDDPLDVLLLDHLERHRALWQQLDACGVSLGRVEVSHHRETDLIPTPRMVVPVEVAEVEEEACRTLGALDEAKGVAHRLDDARLRLAR